MVFQKPSDPFTPHGLLYSRNIVIAHLRTVKVFKMFVTHFFHSQSQFHSLYCSCVRYRSTNKAVGWFHVFSTFFSQPFESTECIKFIHIRSFDAMNAQRVFL